MLGTGFNRGLRSAFTRQNAPDSGVRAQKDVYSPKWAGCICSGFLARGPPGIWVDRDVGAQADHVEEAPQKGSALPVGPIRIEQLTDY